MRGSLLVAFRLLKPSRSFVTVLSGVGVVGVAIGVAVLFIVLSVMNGFDAELRSKILGFNPHLTINANSGLINIDAMHFIHNPAIVECVPVVAGPVLLETSPTNGAVIQDSPWLKSLAPNEKFGSLILGTSNLDGRGLLVGSKFAEHLNLRIGDHVSLYSARELRQLKEALAKDSKEAILPDDYEVRGIFATGYFEYDSRVIIASLSDAQDLYDLDDKVQSFSCKLVDPEKAQQIASDLRTQLGPTFAVSAWQDQNSTLLAALVVEKNVMFFLLSLILLIAALCVFSAQLTFVTQKTKEIGLFYATGATGLQVSSIFLIQSICIGSVGSLAGIVLGALGVAYRNNILHGLRHLTNWELFPAAIYGFSDLPALVNIADFYILVPGAILVCLCGSILPALYASTIQPANALRHD